MDWQMIVSAVAGILVTLLGGYPFFRKLVIKIEQAGIAAKEVSDVLLKANAALADNTLTAEEIAQIQQELIEARDALKALFSKVILDA